MGGLDPNLRTNAGSVAKRVIGQTSAAMERVTDMVEEMLVAATDVTVDHLISDDVQAAVAHETEKMADRMN